MTPREHWNPWWITAMALLVSAALLVFGRGHPGSINQSMTFSITVVPADAVNLDCSSDQRFGDVHCAFDGQGKPLTGAKPLRPYVTVNRELLLLSGVFEDPRVAAWLQRSRQIGGNERVTLDCKASLLGRLQSIGVRWQMGAAWGKEADVPVAAIQSCAVTH